MKENISSLHAYHLEKRGYNILRKKVGIGNIIIGITMIISGILTIAKYFYINDILLTIRAVRIHYNILCNI